MKKIILFAIALLGFTTIALCQAKPVKAIIKTPSVQCDMCKKRIENYMMREPGIKTVDVNVKKKETTVTYLTDRTDIEQIKTAIANVGYDADDVTAEESVYKKLPACCKKPAATEEKKEVAKEKKEQ